MSLTPNTVILSARITTYELWGSKIQSIIGVKRDQPQRFSKESQIALELYVASKMKEGNKSKIYFGNRSDRLIVDDTSIFLTSI